MPCIVAFLSLNNNRNMNFNKVTGGLLPSLVICLKQTTNNTLYTFKALKRNTRIKKTILIFPVAILFFSVSSSAQNIYKTNDSLKVAILYDSLLNLRKGNNYDIKELRTQYIKAVPKFVKTFGEEDHRTIYSFSVLGFLHREVGDFQAAKEIIDRGIQIVEAAPKKNNAAQIYYSASDLAVGMGEYNKAIEYCDKGFKYAENFSFERGQLLNVKGIAYMQMYDTQNAIKYFEEYIENSKKRKDQSVDIKQEIAFAYGNIAICNAQMGKLNMAKENFLQSLLFFKEVKSHVHTVSALMNLARVCNIQEDIEGEILYLQQAKGFQLKYIAQEHPEMVRIYLGLGGVQLVKQDFKAATTYFEEALAIARKVYKSGEHVEQVKRQIANTLRLSGKFQESINSYLSIIPFYQNGGTQYLMPLSVSYYILGLNYKEIKEYNEAKKYLEKSLEIKKELRPEGHQEFGEIYLALAENELGRNRPEDAYPYAIKAKSIFLSKFGEKHTGSAESQICLSEYYLQKNDFEASKKAVQEALGYFSSKSPENHFFNYQEFDIYKNYSQIPLFLHQKTNIYLRSFNYSGDKSDILIALKTVDNAIDIIEEQRSTINRKNSQIIHSGNFKSIYETGIKTQLNFSLIENNRSFKDKSFEYSEKIKGLTLKENYASFIANNFAQVPEHFTKEKSDLSNEINRIEKIIYEEVEKGTTQDSSLVLNMQNKLFKLQIKSDSLIEIARNKYPKYFQLKFQNKTTTVENIQFNILSTTQALLEYFTGDSSIFAFLITPTDCEIIEIKKNFPLDSLVQQLQQSTYTCHLTDCSEAEKQKEIIDLNKTAHQLYQLIFQPIEQAVDLPEEIIIIPDGVLGYVPFEMLLKELPAENAAFSTYPYLLKDYQISYCYSATLLHEMQQMEKGKAKKDFLAFAPSFGDKESIEATNRSITDIRSELGALRYNVPEVTALQAIMGGDILTGAAATEDAFNQHAPNYRILHLATHGKANEQVGDYAYLAFTEVDDSLENELLYSRDLYNLRLNADLVVLSACETGIGELQRGEGIISLARGFSYAGARSIVTTLWSINDATTKELMEGFYSNIKAGMTKDAALRKAKLEYIESHPNDQVHPFYWAAFVPIGEMSPVELGDGNWWMWAIGCILFFGFFIFFFWKRK